MKTGLILILAALLMLSLVGHGRAPVAMIENTSAPAPKSALAVTRFPRSAAEVDLASPLRPPAEYQDNNAALVIFGDARVVQRLCAGSATLRKGQIFLGCEGEKDGAPIIVVPNPCLMPESDFYAGIVCHELGHENGWRHR